MQSDPSSLYYGASFEPLPKEKPEKRQYIKKSVKMTITKLNKIGHLKGDFDQPNHPLIDY